MFDIFGKKRIAELERANANLNRRLQDWEDYRKRIEPLMVQSKITNLAVARIIAKIDPEYCRSEFDSKRRADSDAIGDQVLRKLLSENRTANHHTGES